MMLTVGSLFTGIGGIDLGLERTGHFKTIWMSEIDSYANRVLAKHWPDVPNLGNVKEIDFERVTRPDVIVGGYPCQPFSTAGKRQGENDPRHLWPECLRALRVLRPRYALFENVRGHISLGFPRVLADLASIGFNAEWQVVSAAAVGAPHRRDRLFIVGYPNDNGRATPEVLRGVDEGCQWGEKRTVKTEQFTGSGSKRASMAHPDKSWGKHSDNKPKPCQAYGAGHEIQRSAITSCCHNQPQRCWLPEPDVGRVANGIPARVDRLRALGNAVVPQVAELIGYMIAEHANNA